MVNYRAEGIIFAASNIISYHNFGFDQLKILVNISKESRGRFFEVSHGYGCCNINNIITKDNFERIGLTLAKYAAMGYGKYFGIVLEDVHSEADVYNSLNQLPVKIEKTENYTIQGLNALGFMCCHVTNAAGGYGTVAKTPLYKDPFQNIVTDATNAADYNPFASAIRENGKATLTELGRDDINLGGQIGVIYDYGYIYESQLGPKVGREVVDKKTGISRRTFGVPSVPALVTATGKAASEINNFLLLRKWTVSGIFYTNGVRDLIIERLKRLGDELSFKEYVNGAYWYRTTVKGTPKKIIKVFPVYEIEYGTNKSKIVYMPQNPDYEVKLDKPTNNTWIAFPLGQSQFGSQVEGDYFPYEFYSKLHHISTGTDAGIIEGSFGRGGAGILIVTRDLKEVMLLKRSEGVLGPNLWGIAGGARKENGTGMEDAIITAAVEAKEEMGGLPKGRIKKISYAYKKPGTRFTYHTFALEIDPDERINYKPELNYENTEWKWFTREELIKLNSKKLIHPGVVEILKHLSVL